MFKNVFLWKNLLIQEKKEKKVCSVNFNFNKMLRNKSPREPWSHQFQKLLP